MARVVRFHRTGGPEVLQFDELDIPPPGPGEVRLAIKALGLNRAEAMFRYGQYLDTPRLPARVGYEASGVVEAVGEGVTEVRVGDAVSTIPSFSQNLYGVAAEQALVPARSVAKFPAMFSWVEAAAIWMQYLTATGALVLVGKMQAGDVVLIGAASSSVGLAAIQLARMMGATPVALTRQSAKKERLLACGAAHVVVTGEEDLVSAVQTITGGAGARLVFDPVGGPGLAKLAAATARRGIIFQYGAMGKEPALFPEWEVVSKSLTLRGHALFDVVMDPVAFAAARAFISDGLAAGHLKPVISKTFAFDEIVEAYRYLESNQQVGKVAVTL
ncbi:MAG TPA: zinc-dependent alcohol dehydrogenase family protein [Opitutaceae bacterium]